MVNILCGIAQHMSLVDYKPRMTKCGIKEMKTSEQTGEILVISTPTIVYDITTDENVPLRYEIPLDLFPGCCGMKVVHHMGSDRRDRIFDGGEFRRNGIGQLVFDTFLGGYKLIAEAWEGPGTLYATTIPDQKAGEKILQRSGFTPISKFKNCNTRNVVTLWENVLYTPKTTHPVYEFPKHEISGRCMCVRCLSVTAEANTASVANIANTR